MNGLGISTPLQNLLFRRQFLLGPLAFKPTESWNTLALDHSLVLSTHPELSVSSETLGEISVTIIGFAVDPFHPQKNLSDITQTICSSSRSIAEAIASTRALAGRWVVIFQDRKNTYLFSDPFGFRQVFYYSNGRDIWCGSQPEIIKSVETLLFDADEDLLNFLLSENIVRTESAWIGEKTIYERTYHLIPNHYLDINRLTQIRFYPSKPQGEANLSSVVELSSSILQGIFDAVTRQKKVFQALTAGWDSRVLLAASRKFSKKIQYFVDRQGVLSNSHPDIWVPKKLAHKLGINLIVKNSKVNPPGWFVSILSNNVTGARVLPKTRAIYAHFKNGERRLRINGNGSETCRNFFDKYGCIDRSEITSSLLAELIGYKNIAYVERELSKWKEELDYYNVDILDMLYWEQRLGNWGAQYPAEQDIALEEFSPFNCRLLIDTLLSAPKYQRIAPKYLLYKELIQSMWPDALSYPINPNAKSYIREFKRRVRLVVPESVTGMLNRN